MTLTELLNKTLKKGKCMKYQLLIQKFNDNYLHEEYYIDTCIFDEHTEINSDIYIVLIPFHKPIDIGRVWKYWDVNTIVVTTKEELLKKYSEKQLNDWLEWLDNEVRKEVLEHCL